VLNGRAVNNAERCNVKITIEVETFKDKDGYVAQTTVGNTDMAGHGKTKDEATKRLRDAVAGEFGVSSLEVEIASTWGDHAVTAAKILAVPALSVAAAIVFPPAAPVAAKVAAAGLAGGLASLA
jgi:hypothetical protein